VYTFSHPYKKAATDGESFSKPSYPHPSYAFITPNMPVQSCLAILPSSTSAVVPLNTVNNPHALHGILETSFLTMSLQRHHIHSISEIHNFYVLNFTLTSGICRVLKDLSRSIHKATNPDVNPFETLPSHLDPVRCCKIKMTAPRILQIENFSQNMLLSSTTIEEVHCLFTMAQSIGLETLKWIGEAKRHCELLRRSHGWRWDEGDSIDSNQFPLLENQFLLSGSALEPNNSNALILHLRYSSHTRAQATNIFPSYSSFFQPPAYPSADDELGAIVCNLNITE